MHCTSYSRCLHLFDYANARQTLSPPNIDQSHIRKYLVNALHNIQFAHHKSFLTQDILYCLHKSHHPQCQICYFLNQNHRVGWEQTWACDEEPNNYPIDSVHPVVLRSPWVYWRGNKGLRSRGYAVYRDQYFLYTNQQFGGVPFPHPIPLIWCRCHWCNPAQHNAQPLPGEDSLRWLSVFGQCLTFDSSSWSNTNLS